MNEQSIVWAIFAPLSVLSLEEEVEDFRPPRMGLGAKFQPQWEFKECDREFAMLINRTSGTRDTLEWPIAKHLSRLLDKPVFVVYPDPDPDEDAVLQFEQGELATELPDDPFNFARKFGCSLSESKEVPKQVEVRGVAIVEGQSAEKVASVLGFKKPPQNEDDNPRITDGSAGAVVVYRDYDDLSMTAYEISDAFPETDLYLISTGPMPGRFLVMQLSDSKITGIFDYKAPAAGNNPPPLDSVKDESEPVAIAAALGVSRETLDLEQFA